MINIKFPRFKNKSLISLSKKCGSLLKPIKNLKLFKCILKTDLDKLVHDQLCNNEIGAFLKVNNNEVLLLRANEVILWNVRNNNFNTIIKDEHMTKLYMAKFGISETQILCAGIKKDEAIPFENKICVYDIKKATKQETLSGHNYVITHMIKLNDCYFASGSTIFEEIIIWDLKDLSYKKMINIMYSSFIYLCPKHLLLGLRGYTFQQNTGHQIIAINYHSFEHNNKTTYRYFKKFENDDNINSNNPYLIKDLLKLNKNQIVCLYNNKLALWDIRSRTCLKIILVGDNSQSIIILSKQKIICCYRQPFSNRLGMSPLIRRAEGVIKTHREVADEKPAAVGDFQTGQRALHQPVGFKRNQGREFTGEVLLKVDTQLLRHCGEVKREVTHHAHDRFTADFIFLGQEVGAV